MAKWHVGKEVIQIETRYGYQSGRESLSIEGDYE
jgi:hypothetical protein